MVSYYYLVIQCSWNSNLLTHTIRRTGIPALLDGLQTHVSKCYVHRKTAPYILVKT